MFRQPVVAGYFYPAEKDELEDFFSKAKGRNEQAKYNYPKAVIVPHAGYMYSGKIAFKTLYSINLGQITLARVRRLQFTLRGHGRRLLVK